MSQILREVVVVKDTRASEALQSCTARLAPREAGRERARNLEPEVRAARAETWLAARVGRRRAREPNVPRPDRLSKRALSASGMVSALGESLRRAVDRGSRVRFEESPEPMELVPIWIGCEILYAVSTTTLPQCPLYDSSVKPRWLRTKRRPLQRARSKARMTRAKKL